MVIIHFPRIPSDEGGLVGPFSDTLSAVRWVDENGRHKDEPQIHRLADPAEIMFGKKG